MNWQERKKYNNWKKFEPRLEVADIIFIHNRYGVIAPLIRKVTNSYWNHVALVFKIPNEKKLFRNTLIIEASDYGIEIHRIQRYSKNLKQFDIAVKRVPGLTKADKKRIIAFMLNKVDVPYDYKRLAAGLIRHYWHNLIHERRELFIDKNKLICSSFIQRAFCEALPANSTYFKNIGCEADIDDITPGDIARSKNSKWMYNKI